MGKGFFWGLIWGWVVSLLGLAAASLYLPMPDAVPRPTAIEVPDESEFSRSQDDLTARLPTEEGGGIALAAPEPVATDPASAQPDPTAGLDTSSTGLPQVALESPGTLPNSGAIDATASESNDISLPQEEGAGPGLLGEGTPEPVQRPEPQTNRLPQIEAKPAPQGNTTPEIPPATIAIGVPVAPLVSQSQAPAADSPGRAITAAERALVRNAQPFDNPQAKPLMSIILITPGDSILSADQLAALSFPVTLAVDPLSSDAALKAQTYFEAGYEVVFLADGIPKTANAQDIEVALEGSLVSVPVAVAIMDSEDNRLRNNRSVQQQTAERLARTGHGILTYEGGLGGGLRDADRLGVPSASIFRKLDGDGESAFAIKRYLARAAFRAGQAGDVIVVGQASAETLQAVVEWALDERPNDVALAPISAVLVLPR